MFEANLLLVLMLISGVFLLIEFNRLMKANHKPDLTFTDSHRKIWWNQKNILWRFRTGQTFSTEEKSKYLTKAFIKYRQGTPVFIRLAIVFLFTIGTDLVSLSLVMRFFPIFLLPGILINQVLGLSFFVWQWHRLEKTENYALMEKDFFLHLHRTLQILGVSLNVVSLQKFQDEIETALKKQEEKIVNAKKIRLEKQKVLVAPITVSLAALIFQLAPLKIIFQKKTYAGLTRFITQFSGGNSTMRYVIWIMIFAVFPIIITLALKVLPAYLDRFRFITTSEELTMRDLETSKRIVQMIRHQSWALRQEQDDKNHNPDDS